MNPTPINLTVASNAADAAAVEAVEQHHAQLGGELAALVEALLTSASPAASPAASTTTSPTTEPDDTAQQLARQRLVEFCSTQLMPHAEAEEQALYPAAAQDVRAKLLVDSMIAEHRMLRLLVDEIAATTRPVVAAALAMALRVLFDVHLAKENELILPLIAADPQVSLAGILAGMHELLGHAAEGCGHGDCGCGGDDACGCGSEAHGCGCGHDEARPASGAMESDSGCTCGCGDHRGAEQVAELAPAVIEPVVAATGGCGCGSGGCASR